MNKKRKPKRYLVVCWYLIGKVDGIDAYAPKYVSEWPSNPREWGARFEISPNCDDAIKFGRDTALYVANTIRMRNGALAMVQEA